MRLSPRATAEVMVQILRATSSLAFIEGLNPAQWAALRYFSQANPSACTVTAFARYHGTTKGTASQTISALTKKELLSRRKDGADGRNVFLELTARGREVLVLDPINELSDAINSLEDGQLTALAEGLERVMRSLLAKRAISQREGNGRSVPSSDADDGSSLTSVL